MKIITAWNSAAVLLLTQVKATVAAPYRQSASTTISRRFVSEFDSAFDTNTWKCEYTCPTVSDGALIFHLEANVEANQEGSWSKARYAPQRFTSGTFSARFKLSARPTDAPVWWGVALWDDGPDDESFNEINFGYTTDQSFSETELYFESAKRGNATSVRVNTGVDLCDENWHTGTLEYDAEHVAFYFDGTKLAEITDTGYIPTDAMDFLLGPRLVSGKGMLSEDFLQSVDRVEISTGSTIATAITSSATGTSTPMTI
jgi:hypothetical protein